MTGLILPSELSLLYRRGMVSAHAAATWLQEQLRSGPQLIEACQALKPVLDLFLMVQHPTSVPSLHDFIGMHVYLCILAFHLRYMQSNPELHNWRERLGLHFYESSYLCKRLLEA